MSALVLNVTSVLVYIVVFIMLRTSKASSTCRIEGYSIDRGFGKLYSGRLGFSGNINAKQKVV